MKIGISKVNLLGTSGGAIIALNAVLEKPNLFDKIIVDSFMGENLSYEFAEKILGDRKIAKSKLSSKIFWFMMHGYDWKKVIDQNTNLIMNFARGKGNFFECDLKTIKNDTLITGSLKDDLIPNIENTLKSINSKIENSKLVIFKNGNHPAMFSNKKEFRNLVLNFLR